MEKEKGDKVHIKSKKWYETYKDPHNGNVATCKIFFDKEMADYCGKEATITAKTIDFPRYKIDIDKGEWWWTDDMFAEEGDMFKEESGNSVINWEERQWQATLQIFNSGQDITSETAIRRAKELISDYKKKFNSYKDKPEI